MKDYDWFGPAIKATPLHYCETVEEAEEFFEKGYKGDEVIAGLNPAIHSVEDIHLLEAFLKSGANPNAGLPNIAPIHTHVDAKCIKLLIEYGADVNAQDQFGCTALHYCQNIEALKVLIEKGVNPNLRDYENELPEDHYGDNDNYKEMKKYLQSVRYKES